ncbi:translation initiation factor IF-3, mitochondrial isoform X1 [Conger conger]|uniref:translation initiation factor IF-3, mitochondrial isoform X1 n=1 Tax=Conger conger TaxID=82655 RepID=UPI002A5B0AB1|nr:translation initiation factor IF-3, mitochondrial isoform X1 [Conger conger]XP_061106413.1 translation initiation factor IF-3, mitochondrial isoform X1 [Conger conger]XP_061106414.1 translation initiation factor IF-3, mitochondrial isoform X1 [Conger conger]XP_061106415.1 translation initiation factor IF-3, mitochondrial isoform X1 [Conger conger]
MSTTCLRWAMSQVVTGRCHFRLGPWRPPALFSTQRAAPCSMTAALSTTADGEDAPRKKQYSAHTHSTIGSVGRMIDHRILQVIGHDGADLGTMHRVAALQLMDQQGLKLVILDEKKDPPVYQLMTGKQIQEVQLKLREKQKNQAGPARVKEVTLKTAIASHDLDTKLRQIQSWLSKKCHVRVTLKKRKDVNNTQPLDSELKEIIQRIPTTVGFVSEPRLIQDGKAAMCILRGPSKKEMHQQGAPSKEPIQSPSSAVADAKPAPDGTDSSPLQQ